jgi:hypothetical protein
MVYQETGHKDWAETEQRKEQPLDSGNCAESSWLVIFLPDISIR